MLNFTSEVLRVPVEDTLSFTSVSEVRKLLHYKKAVELRRKHVTQPVLNRAFCYEMQAVFSNPIYCCDYYFKCCS